MLAKEGTDILPSVGNPYIFVAAGGYALIDALYRLFCGTRPFDRLMLAIDAAVLVVSTAGLVVTWLAWKRYGLRKRRRAVREFIRRGQQLLQQIDTPEWGAAINQLIQDVADFLQKHSPDALAIFNDTSDMPTTVNPALYGIQGDFERLNHCLRNLRSIMENAGEYFQ